MDTDQPHVSDIIQGKLSGFTIDHLFKFLLDIGLDIKIKIKDHKTNQEPPGIYVLEEPMAV